MTTVTPHSTHIFLFRSKMTDNNWGSGVTPLIPAGVLIDESEGERVPGPEDLEGVMMFRNPVFEPITGAESEFLMSIQGS